MPWLLALLAEHGIADVDGDIWLQTYPRVWGYTFKAGEFLVLLSRAPVRRWRAACRGAEVNNTFGERHCYVLDAPRLGPETWWRTRPSIVSLLPRRGHYVFCFRTPGADGVPT